MQLYYGALRTFAVILILWGICCLFCVGAVEDDLNRKAGELFTAAIQAERQGKNSDAEKAFDDCVRFAKENKLPKLETLSLHRLAILKAKEQKFAESEKLFREAIQRNSEDVIFLCDFAKLFSDQKKFSDAETVLKNAVLIAPDNRRVLFSLGSVIAFQNDRQTEGLRYLKLAIGEVAAYRELARIYRLNGNQGQAEFAEQRVALLEKKQPDTPLEPLTSQTVTMDAQTKKELVDHVKEELLRLETFEIAEEQSKMPDTVQSFVQEIPPTQHSLTKSQEPLPQNPQPAQLNPVMVSETITVKDSSVPKPAFDPFLAMEKSQLESPKTEVQKTEILSIPVQTEVTKVTTTPSVHDPFLVSVTVNKSDHSIEIPNENNITEPFKATEQPEIVEKPLSKPEMPKQARLKIIKPQQTFNEPIKVLPKFVVQDTPTKVQDTRKTNEMRTLPATENQASKSSTTNRISLPSGDRISNSTEREWKLSQQTELPALAIIPMETPSIVKSVPRYMEIQKNSSEDNGFGKSRAASVFQSDDFTMLASVEQDVSDNLNEIKPMDEDYVRKALKQPMNLRSLDSPNDVLHTLAISEPFKRSAGYRKVGERKAADDSSDSFVQNRPQNTANLQSSSVWNSGAGKRETYKEPDSYVYVDYNSLKEKPQPSQSKVSSIPKSDSEAAPSTLSKPTPSTGSSSFSLMKPMPGKLAHQVENQPSIQVPAQTQSEEITSPPKEIVITQTPTPLDNGITNEQQNAATEIKTERIIASLNKPISETASIPVVKPEVHDEIRSDIQFALTQAPTVLKFEVASGGDKPADLLAHSNQPLPQPSTDTFQPPTILKFGPAQNAQNNVVTKSTPISNTVQNLPQDSIPKTNTELKTEIVSTTPQQTASNLESFVADKQVKSVQIEKSASDLFVDPFAKPATVDSSSDVANETTAESQPIPEPTIHFTNPIAESPTKPTVESFNDPFAPLSPLAEQKDQQPETLSNSESPKFTVPNQPQPSLPQQAVSAPPSPQLALTLGAVHHVEQEYISETETRFITPKLAAQPKPKAQPEQQSDTSQSVARLFRKPSLPVQNESVTESDKNAPIPVEIASRQSASTSKPVLKALEQSQGLQNQTQNQTLLPLPKLKPESVTTEEVTLNTIPKKANIQSVIPETEDNSIGLAITRKKRSIIRPPMTEVSEAVNDFLKPQEGFSTNPIFDEEEEEDAGFARSGQYSRNN